LLGIPKLSSFHIAYAGILTEFKIASFILLAFWKTECEELLRLEDGGPLGGKFGVLVIGDVAEDGAGLRLPIKDWRPEELEPADPYGLPTEVIVRVTVLVDGRVSAGADETVALVNVRVKYLCSSIVQIDMIIFACNGAYKDTGCPICDCFFASSFCGDIITSTEASVTVVDAKLEVLSCAVPAAGAEDLDPLSFRCFVVSSPVLMVIGVTSPGRSFDALLRSATRLSRNSCWL
jgi:hypothetical protein